MTKAARRGVIAGGCAIAAVVAVLTGLSITGSFGSSAAHGVATQTAAHHASVGHQAGHAARRGHGSHVRRLLGRDHTTTIIGASTPSVPAPTGRWIRHHVNVPSFTVLARLHGATPGYESATAPLRSMIVPGAWYGRTSILPVIRQTADRVLVRLARRPNESTIWVNRKDVTLGSTSDAIVVDIPAHHLYLFENGRTQASFPVGVGAPATPTPRGTYFVAFHAPPTNYSYGPVMLETSAHSNVYQTFEGGNDAIIAIHGPVGSDAEIGSHGAAISNGCIRMHSSQLARIANVPDGTPILLVG
ncbi:MAG TPA: L,D-transpeptidase [Mycobacteriales bacterium]|nr:L,D-transpeptidase [Mycobacteriales bacterium]